MHSILPEAIKPKWQKIFLKFLISEECYKEWLEIYSNQRWWGKEILSPLGLIGGMRGSDLPLGYDFWYEVFNKWQNVWEIRCK